LASLAKSSSTWDAKSSGFSEPSVQNSRYKDGTTKNRSIVFVPYRALQSDRCLVITTWYNFHGGNTGSNPVGDAKPFQELASNRRNFHRHKKAQPRLDAFQPAVAPDARKLGILRLSPALLVDAVRDRLWRQQQRQATDELCVSVTGSANAGMIQHTTQVTVTVQ
jgi:hypothetical protein